MGDTRPEAVLSDEERELLRGGSSNATVGMRGGSAVDEDPLLFDEDYPPPPPGYNLALEPRRRTNMGRLLVVGLSVVAACTLVAALIGARDRSNNYNNTTCTKMRSAQCFGDFVLSAMDRSADPCANFYEYACGSWLRKQTIPPDRTAYSRSFSRVFDGIREELRTLLEVDLQVVAHPNAIAGRFYTSCMKGMATGPLNYNVLAKFRPIFSQLVDARSFAHALSTLHSSLSAGMFDIDIGVDEKHPHSYAVSFGQGGLGLSHPDKYTSEKEADIKVRAAYMQLIQGHLRVCVKAKLIRSQNIEELAKKTFDFEKSLAYIHKPPEAMRDPEKLYNPTKLDSFPRTTHIEYYLEGIGIDKAKINNTIIVEDPKYLQEIGNMLARVAGAHNADYRDAVKGYLAFHLVRHFAGKGVLGEELFNDAFRFRMVTSGVKKMPEKWKQCQALTSANLGDALGQAFVKKHFPAERKEVAERLARQITHAFAESLQRQEWMDATTRGRAQEKLSAINWKVGYTRKFDKYPGVQIGRRRSDFANNVVAAEAYRKRYSIGRLGKPVDPTEWFMNAYETNAYYSPPRNEMVFPAGILQQPFFSDVYPDAMNYGSIGMVIGHEMSHGFDDEGRKYDKDGRLTPWWSPASARKYVAKAQCFVDLFNAYKPRAVDTYVKGNLTLGENLADTNGVKVAFAAFKAANANNSDPAAPAPNLVLADELTNHQLFFVSYAQTWCYKWRPKALALAMLTDPHSPGQFRVRGPLSQIEEFATTFKCKPGSTYNPEKRCKLW